MEGNQGNFGKAPASSTASTVKMIYFYFAKSLPGLDIVCLGPISEVLQSTPAHHMRNLS